MTAINAAAFAERHARHAADPSISAADRAYHLREVKAWAKWLMVALSK